MVTGWTVPDDAFTLRRQPSREKTFSFYGRLELLMRGPAAFIAEVADYFWPQICPTVTDPGSITIEMLVGGITATALTALPRRPVALYRSPDGPIPDWNDGIRYPATPWGKTTTLLAALASGTTLISNDRLYVWPTSSQTTVLGWTDPIRVIGTAPEAPKRIIPLIQHAHGDRDQVSGQPLPLAAVVVPDVRPGPCPLACVELDEATGGAALRAEVLPQRVRWLGLKPEPRPPAASPSAPRYLRISYAYQDAHLAATTLRAAGIHGWG